MKSKIPKSERAKFTYTEKLLYILAQGKPNMNNYKHFDYRIEEILGTSGIREYHVFLTLGKEQRVIFEEVFNTPTDAQNWANKFIFVHNKGA